MTAAYYAMTTRRVRAIISNKHVGEQEQPYIFLTIEQLVADFFQDVMRWHNENGNA
jgi:hypothetical protein